MIPWRDTAFAFGALPEIGPLLLSATPALVWSRDGSRVLFANPAAGRMLGASTFPALAERRWPEAHQLRRSLAGLARALPEQGMLARLRLSDRLPALPAACRCQPVRTETERGVLVVLLEENGRPPPPSALAAFFSGVDVGAAVTDAAGEAVAESTPEAADAIRSSTPSLEFVDGKRRLWLYVVERKEAKDEAEELVPPAPFLNDAGLVIRAPVSGGERAAESDREVAPARPARRAETEPVPPATTPAARESAPETPRSKVAAIRSLPRSQATTAKRANGEPAPSEKAHSEKPQKRAVMAGRVAQDLSRKAVRFLWQTDSADRYLFVSPGLAQVVGRNAEVIGERWQEVSSRLRLDPTGRIALALRERDTWSGLTAWWPIEGSSVRVPVELTALPVFGPDQSFQGYRGFGILRPAEALMPAAFEARFAGSQSEQQPTYEEAAATATANVVPIRSDLERADHALTQQERNAFEEIASALRDRVAAGLAEARAMEPEEEISEPPSDDEPDMDDRSPEPDAAPSDSEQDSRQPEEPLPARTESAAPSLSVKRPGAPPEIFVERNLPLRISSAQLVETQRRLRETSAILDTATDGVLILDREGRIESVNASAEALFGLDAHEMEARAFTELLTPASRKAGLDYLAGLRESGVASILNEGREVEAIAGSGSIPLFITMGRISSEEGGRFCAVLRDITHWKRIETELLSAKLAAEQASQQKSDFLARVSHEIRTPLNAIIGFAEVMIEERFGAIANERYRDYLRDIRTSGEHVVSLVNDLLDISKIEAGKLEIKFAAVALNDIVRESINLMQPQASRARVVLRSSLSKEVPAIVADERTLRQIVLNLLSNSVKFTGPGGQVIASTSLSESGEAILRVRDTGEGMTEAEVARALEPFRQLSNAAIGDRGTGLGLPLTKALVEANRATLSIKSARGEGTVVTVTIPATRVLSE